MADYEQQARKNIKEAQKRLNSWSLPFIGSLNSSRYEEAAELYEKAGNMFKLAQQCKQLCLFLAYKINFFQQGKMRVMPLQKQPCYLCGEMVPSLKGQEPTTMQQKAINEQILKVQKRIQSEREGKEVNNGLLAAITALEEAVKLDQEGGNFRSAARHYQDIAELYENELNRPNDAFKTYKEAANLYLADESPA